MTLKLEVVPDKAIVIRRDRTIVAASWFGRWVERPYIYPFLAPGDREVTRLGHPGDPVGHSHHRSIWIGHHDVGGVDFWGGASGSPPRSRSASATASRRTPVAPGRRASRSATASGAGETSLGFSGIRAVELEISV